MIFVWNINHPFMIVLCESTFASALSKNVVEESLEWESFDGIFRMQ